MKKTKAQGTMEIVIIAGIALAIIGVLFYSVQTNTSNSNDALDTQRAQMALDDLQRIGESVYQQGNGAQAEAIISLPSDIQSITFLGNKAQIIFNSGKVEFRNLDYQASGTISEPAEGEQRIPVFSTDNGVCFGPANTCVICGNGIREGNEECDDNNLADGDSCSSICQIETAQPVCVDGTVNQLSEQCDDSNTINGDGCSSTCQTENPAACGDGSINQLSEQCDDGNTANGDGCNSICILEAAPAICGDGSINQANETCDDGNTANGDGCSSICQNEIVAPVCGDGTVNQASEECDDHNIESFDGCSNICKIENDTSSITVCMVMTDARGNITIGSNRAGVTLIVNNSIPKTTSGTPATAILPNTTFTTPLTMNADIFGNDAIKDGQCNTYYGLLIGSYYYGNVLISGGSWQEPLYNDQYSQQAINTSYFYKYDYSLYDGNPNNDGSRNLNVDGNIVLSGNRTKRTLVVLIRYPVICGDGIINQANETCDDENSISGDGCSNICKTEVCGNNICDANENSNTCETDCAPKQAQCLSINVAKTALANNNKRITGVNITNICANKNVYIVGANITFTSNAKLTAVNISSANRWTSNCNFGCTPSGQQSSGKNVYFNAGNATPYLLSPGQQRILPGIDFSSSISGQTIKVGFVLNDSTKNASGSFGVG